MKKYIPEYIFVILELLLTSVQYFEHSLANLLHGDRFHSFAIITSFQIFLIIAYLAIRFRVNIDNNEQILQDIKNAAEHISNSQPLVYAINEDYFYKQFADEIRKSDKAVAMCHLDKAPPVQIHGTSAETYYRGLLKLIKENKQVRFQRVERASPEKINWINQLIKDYEGVQNFSLACLVTHSQESKLGYISTQLIDDDIAFLVAIAQHYGAYSKRDIMIKDKTITELWRRYYDEILWARSLIIIEHGVINQTNLDNIILRMSQEG